MRRSRPIERPDGRGRRSRRFPTAINIALVFGAVVLVGIVARPDVRDALTYELEPKESVPAALGDAPIPTASRLEAAGQVDDAASAVRWPAASDGEVVRLAAAGDVGTGGTEEYDTAAAMDALEGSVEYSALLLLGDNVYEDGDPSKVDEVVFAPFAGVLDGGTKLLPVLGNHDQDSGFGDAQAAALGMPDRWYSTSIGDVLIVSLDSTRPDDPDQLDWLTSELAGSSARWTIVEMHHPPYSGGAHGSSLDVRDAFSPLFEEYGVQLVLSGHDHDFQRSQIINGVTYIVSGAAAKLRDAHRADFAEVAFSTYHFVDISVGADSIDVQAVDQQGQVLDRVSIGGPHESPGGRSPSD